MLHCWAFDVIAWTAVELWSRGSVALAAQPTRDLDGGGCHGDASQTDPMTNTMRAEIDIYCAAGIALSLP